MSPVVQIILSFGLPVAIIVVMAILMAYAKKAGIITLLLYILTLVNCAVIYLVGAAARRPAGFDSHRSPDSALHLRS
jgi:uncharacterized membrane protein